FQFASGFEPHRCADPYYLLTFAPLQLLSMAFELAMPWVLATYGHEFYRNRLRQLLRPVLQRRQVSPSDERNQIKIRNVLGEQVL
ncbi:hypothetical protein PMAYCL1PPCAC_16850, partial [Pristionchus mayeri]